MLLGDTRLVLPARLPGMHVSPCMRQDAYVSRSLAAGAVTNQCIHISGGKLPAAVFKYQWSHRGAHVQPPANTKFPAAPELMPLGRVAMAIRGDLVRQPGTPSIPTWSHHVRMSKDTPKVERNFSDFFFLSKYGYLKLNAKPTPGAHPLTRCVAVLRPWLWPSDSMRVRTGAVGPSCPANGLPETPSGCRHCRATRNPCSSSPPLPATSSASLRNCTRFNPA